MREHTNVDQSKQNLTKVHITHTHKDRKGQKKAKQMNTNVIYISNIVKLKKRNAQKSNGKKMNKKVRKQSAISEINEERIRMQHLKRWFSKLLQI